MSDVSRPTVRWSSSMSMPTKSNQTTPLILSRRKTFRSSTTNQHTFAHRMAKTRHDIQELFKLYSSNRIKFDTFQRQIITGKRIPSAKALPLIQNHLTDSSLNVFNSKHCVSREHMSPSDMNCNEHQIINDETKELPIKRTVQVRIDNNPTIVQSTVSLSSSSPTPTPVISTTSNFNSIAPQNSSLTQQDEFNESSFVKSVALLRDTLTDSLEKKTKPSLITLPSIQPPALSLINNRKDSMTLSHSSFLTMNSLQQQNQSHIVTGTAVTVCQRSSTKPIGQKQRIKTTMTCSQQTNTKTSPLSIQYDLPESPVYIGTQRVVSIPSKCSRYVLLTFPKIPSRYNAPTYVERLLLPERFPTLFQNIIQSGEHNRHNE